MCGKAVIQIQIIGKRYPVYCEVKVPEECKVTYAVDEFYVTPLGGVEDGQRIVPLSM
jgi:hypothetical protein